MGLFGDPHRKHNEPYFRNACDGGSLGCSDFLTYFSHDPNSVPTSLGSTSTDSDSESTTLLTTAVTQATDTTSSASSSQPPNTGFTPIPSSNTSNVASSSSVASSDSPSVAPSTIASVYTTPSSTDIPPSSAIEPPSISSSAVSSGLPASSPSSFPAAADATHKSINAGAIAGGVIGGIGLLFFVVLTIMFRKRLMKRLRRFRSHRVAPSAEFLNGSSQLFSSQSRLGRPSPSPNPYVPQQRGPSTYSTGDVYNPNEGPHDDNEQLPPFTVGTFSDPVFEKVHSAARQREMFLQAHGTPSPGSYRDADADSPSSYNPYATLNSFTSYANYTVDSADFPASSPILSSEDHGTLGGASSARGHTAPAPRSSENAGWAV